MDHQIKKITPKHDSKVCEIIKTVGGEFGAIGEGFGPSDSEVLAMSQHYSDDSSSLYLVAIVGGNVVGGSGVAALNGSKEVCELRKLFLLPEVRGVGIGKELAENCLKYASNKGYKKCYLDTLGNMEAAISLYEKLGFKHLAKPLEESIHNGCDVWMLKEL